MIKIYNTDLHQSFSPSTIGRLVQQIALKPSTMAHQNTILTLRNMIKLMTFFYVVFLFSCMQNPALEECSYTANQWEHISGEGLSSRDGIENVLTDYHARNSEFDAKMIYLFVNKQNKKIYKAKFISTEAKTINFLYFYCTGYGVIADSIYSAN